VGQVTAHSADRLAGCLLGGAVGDALGANVEFDSAVVIRRRLGPQGVTGYVPGAWPVGAVTDDTQMTLFTAEGLLRARTRGWPRASSTSRR
jgi:ADP-ribosylglycohydrolase